MILTSLPKQDKEPDKGISFWVQPSSSEASVDLYIYSMPYEFNKVYAPYFKNYLDKNGKDIEIAEFKKNLAGGSLSLKKTIPLLQDDSLAIVIDKTKEMIANFEQIIESSIAECKEKEAAAFS